MIGVIFDTSVYVNASRQGDPSIYFSRFVTLPEGEILPVSLSAVVLEELYAGVVDSKSEKFVAKLENDFVRIGRLLTPSQSDWIAAGKVLNGLGRKYGFEHIGKSRMTNDTLIAMTTRRSGLLLLTKNQRDFTKIAQFRKFNWRQI